MSLRLAVCTFIVAMCFIVVGIKNRSGGVQNPTVPPPPTGAPLILTVDVPLPRQDVVGIIASGIVLCN